MTRPRTVLAGLVQEKLEQGGIFDTDLVQRIATAIVASDEETHEVEIDLSFDLEFTEADYEHLSPTVEQLVEGMPKLLETMGKDMARDIADDFRAQWQAQAAKVVGEREKLRRKIAGRWGGSIFGSAVATRNLFKSWRYLQPSAAYLTPEAQWRPQ